MGVIDLFGKKKPDKVSSSTFDPAGVILPLWSWLAD